LADLHEAQTSEEIVLKIVALLWYMRLLPYTPDDVSEPVYGSYLLDFGRLLDGQQFKNQRAALERMALSISRVAGAAGSALGVCGERVEMEVNQVFLSYDTLYRPASIRTERVREIYKVEMVIHCPNRSLPVFPVAQSRLWQQDVADLYRQTPSGPCQENRSGTFCLLGRRAI
jgi:hypothetical protein